MAKDTLQLITITSDQAILMSVCLQSLVDELLMKKKGIRKKQKFYSKSGNWSYMKRDGSSQLIVFDNQDSVDPCVSTHLYLQIILLIYFFMQDEEDADPTRMQESFSIKKLQEKFSTVSFKSGREFIENHAFEGIGDEDL